MKENIPSPQKNAEKRWAEMGQECPGRQLLDQLIVQSKKGVEIGTSGKIKGDMSAPPRGCLCGNERWGTGKYHWRKPSTPSQWKLSCQQIPQAAGRTRQSLRNDTDSPLTCGPSLYVSILSTTPEKSMPRKNWVEGRLSLPLLHIQLSWPRLGRRWNLIKSKSKALK